MNLTSIISQGEHLSASAMASIHTNSVRFSSDKTKETTHKCSSYENFILTEHKSILTFTLELKTYFKICFSRVCVKVSTVLQVHTQGSQKRGYIMDTLYGYYGSWFVCLGSMRNQCRTPSNSTTPLVRACNVKTSPITSLASQILSSLNASAILTALKKGLVTLASKFCAIAPELWHSNQIVEYYFLFCASCTNDVSEVISNGRPPNPVELEVNRQVLRVIIWDADIL